MYAHIACVKPQCTERKNYNTFTFIFNTCGMLAISIQQ